MHILMEQLWIKANYWHPDERARVQLSFFPLMLFYTASRPGVIVEFSSYRGSSEALRYKVYRFHSQSKHGFITVAFRTLK
jgi:hypothetical protein